MPGRHKKQRRNNNREDSARRKGRGQGGGQKHGRGDDSGRGSRETRGSGRGRGVAGRPQKVFLGKIDKNKSGFAFVLPNEGGQDVYIDRQQARDLMEGDIVEYTVSRSGPKLNGEIKKIVEHGTKAVVGQAIWSNGDWWLRVSEWEQFLLMDSVKLREGVWLTADIVEYAQGNRPPLVKVKDILGDKLSPKHDVMIAATKFNLPTHFGKDALDFAESLKQEAKDQATAEGRRDLRAQPFVTIDGITAKDFDDAVLVKKTDAGFVLYVAIADVAFFVRPGSALDRDAISRSTSVYFPGTCIPMLPESLSNDLCSLRPQEDKLTVTAEIHYSRDGRVTNTKFYNSVIKTVRRLTYEEVEGFFEGQPIPDVLKQPMADANELFGILLKLRKERGALDFELSECEILVDAEGRPTDCRPAKRLTSHKLIEEFMIAANSVVAKELTQHGAPALHRIHEPPEPDVLYEIRDMLQRFGIRETVNDLTPKTFSRLLLATADHPSKKALHQSILRSMKQAKYDENPVGHFGLALKDYAHFTSPIRRYPDLVVHRALKGLMHRAKDAEKLPSPSVSNLGPDTSSKERRAMEAERFVSKRKQCWFMKDKVGNEYEGLVTGVTPKGLFVEIPQYCLDGFLPGDDLKGLYEYDESHMCLRERPGHKTIGLGDPIKIQVARVSVEDSEITFTQQDL